MYYKSLTKLNHKKEELFKTGNINKWEIDKEELKNLDKEDLLKNKKLAFSKMMHKVFFN